MQSKLIVLEGIEAAGKGKASIAILNFLASKGQRVVHTREPGGTPYAEALRTVVTSKEFVTPGICEVMGFYGARCDHTQSLIIPSLESGSHVLSERYYASSFAYQKQTQTELESVHAICQPYLLEPDLVLFLDISPETSVKRMAEQRVAKGIALDKFELRGFEFMKQVRENYLRISKNETPATHKRWCTIDAEQPIEKVHQDIFKILSEALQLPA